MAQVPAQVPRNQKHPSYSSNPNADIDDVPTDDENSMDTSKLFVYFSSGHLFRNKTRYHIR